MRCGVGLALVLVVAPACVRVSPRRVASGPVDARRDAILERQVDKPYPGSGAWHYIDFALAALYRNERVDEANAALVKVHKEFPVDPNPRSGPGAEAVADGHWQINLLHRIWWLFHSKSAFFPGRLTAETEAALLDIFWQSARRHCRIEQADAERTWWIWGSENHGAMSRSGFWGTAHILKEAPGYRDRRYEDGSTPAQMAAAWDAFFRRFARERAGKGLLVEIGSTYNKYTLQGWYNMADFASDPVLKRRMRLLLDLFWADWAVEQIDGIRGGGKHRIYPGRASTRGHASSGQGMAWLYFGLGTPLTQHPGHMCAVTSFYRPPALVADLALDVQGRGSYEYISRRPGLNLLPRPEEAGADSYVLRADYGGILRYSYCTPDFVLGTSMVEARPHADWSNISSQNRWEGVVFGGHPDSRIFAQPLKPARGSVYNQQWSVQHKGVLILQKLRTHRHAHGQRVWFSDDLERVEEGGWVFVEAPRAFAAVRVVRGETAWEPPTPHERAEGAWLVCKDEYTPILLEVVRKDAVSSFEAFRRSVCASALTVRGNELRYASRHYEAELCLYTDASRPPEVDGRPLDMRPAKVFDSPFIESEWDGGVVVLKKGRRRLVLDFTRD